MAADERLRRAVPRKVDLMVGTFGPLLLLQLEPLSHKIIDQSILQDRQNLRHVLPRFRPRLAADHVSTSGFGLVNRGHQPNRVQMLDDPFTDVIRLANIKR